MLLSKHQNRWEIFFAFSQCLNFTGPLYKANHCVVNFSALQEVFQYQSYQRKYVNYIYCIFGTPSDRCGRPYFVWNQEITSFLTPLHVITCCIVLCHNGCFWAFWSKKHLIQISGNFVIQTFKVDTTTMPLFFLIFYSLVPKIDICFIYFLDKFFQKQPLCMKQSSIACKICMAPSGIVSTGWNHFGMSICVFRQLCSSKLIRFIYIFWEGHKSFKKSPTYCSDSKLSDSLYDHIFN